MEKDETSERVNHQLRAVLRGISPLIWRRLLVPSDTTIAQLHDVLQVAFGWEDMHLHRFEIRGREYGLSREGGVFFDTDARKVRIGDLKLRRMERFTYKYDFGDSWIHEIRIEATYCPLNDLLTTHTAPGLEFLLAKWAAHLSFSTVAELLQDVLPVDTGLHQETVRQHVMATADRLEAELGPEQFKYDGGCQRDFEGSPEPGPPITVGLDGGYIRGRDRAPGGTGCFEVIAGKSIPEEGDAKVFALVRRVDKKPKRRLRNVLESQGILPRQQITFLSDGGDTVRELPAFLHPRSEHILDWFHIEMRIEQLMQTARGLRRPVTGTSKELVLKELGRIKWFLWNGNVVRADDTLSSLIDDVASPSRLLLSNRRSISSLQRAS